MSRSRKTGFRFIALLAVCALTSSCAILQGDGATTERSTARDKTKKGAAIGAASGAVLGAVLGEGDVEEILAGAAIGAGVGAGVGAYMDKQEEKIAQIPGTTVERVDEETLLVNFDADILFAVNSAQLDAAARATLADAAEVFQEFDKTAIVVQGHTDSTGASDYNQRLSERRADSVRSHLIASGVDGARIAAIGYGEDHPVADNGTAEGRALNRRVDMLLRAKRK